MPPHVFRIARGRIHYQHFQPAQLSEQFYCSRLLFAFAPMIVVESLPTITLRALPIASALRYQTSRQIRRFYHQSTGENCHIF